MLVLYIDAYFSQLIAYFILFLNIDLSRYLIQHCQAVARWWHCRVCIVLVLHSLWWRLCQVHNWHSEWWEYADLHYMQEWLCSQRRKLPQLVIFFWTVCSLLR